jgi:hypothetical protein
MMKQIGKYAGALALGTLTAGVALVGGMPAAEAQSVSDQSVAQAPAAAPGGGSFPGSLAVPGTNTSLRVGGYAKFDYQYDSSVCQNFVANGAGTAALIAILPMGDNVPNSVTQVGHGIHGCSRTSAAESRFNIETRTPTAYGEVKTFIEGDFEGVSGVITNPATSGAGNANTYLINSDRSAFALRHAYGTLGPLLAGQNFSLFEDLAASPETLDFGGAIGVAGPLRQSQIRYVYPVASGLSLGASLEEPQTVLISANPVTNGAASNVQPTLGSSTYGLGQGEKVPDLVGALIYNQGPGHVALRSVVRDLYDVNPNGFPPPLTLNGAATGFSHSSVFHLGWGVGLSGDYHPFGKDDIMLQAAGGQGVGRYLTNTGNTQGDSVVSPNGAELTPVPAFSGTAAYQHWWTDSLRSTVEGSIIQQRWPEQVFLNWATAGQNPMAPGGIGAGNGAYGSLTHVEYSSHANLIWSPVPMVDLGYEFIFEQRKTEAGQVGNLWRSQVSTKFKF